MALIHDYADIARRMNFGKSKDKSTKDSVFVDAEIISDPPPPCPSCGKYDSYPVINGRRCRYCLKAF